MPDTISFRPTQRDREVLARLAASPTEAIRTALAIAQHMLDDEELRREASALAANPAEQRATGDIGEFMGDVFKDLPE